MKINKFFNFINNNPTHGRRPLTTNLLRITNRGARLAAQHSQTLLKGRYQGQPRQHHFVFGELFQEFVGSTEEQGQRSYRKAGFASLIFCLCGCFFVNFCGFINGNEVNSD
jgi:hypothetical protein